MPKTNNSKMAAVFLTLIVGIFGSYLVIVNVANNGANLKNNDDSLAQLQNADGVYDESNISGGFGENIDNNLGDQSNLTEIFSRSFFNQVQAANITQQSPDDLKKSAGLMSQGVLNDVLKLSPQLKTVADIKNSDLKISGDNSAAFKKQYVKNILDTTKKDFSGIGDKNILLIINDVYGKNDFSSALKAVDCNKNAANDFLAMEVPVNFISFHKKAIVYYMNSEIVFGSMASYSSDLFKGSVALEMVDQILAEADEVQNDFNNISNSMK